MSLYKEIEGNFAALKEVFYNGRKEPFTDICIRRPFDGSVLPPYRNICERREYDKYVRLHGVAPPLVKTPDETDYVAVITLSGYKNVKPYVFKIRKDGAILRQVAFEYDKQSIEKWIKYIQRWMLDSYAFSELRCRNRCFQIKEELMSRLWATEFSDF